MSDINLAWHGEIKHEHPGLYALLTTAREINGDSMMSYLIYMAIRVMEMRRLLKPTGSIYLHCDPTASHYLKLLMDGIFGRDNFRNEIVWKRASVKGTRGPAKTLGTVIDNILFYAKSPHHVIAVPRSKRMTPGMRPFKHRDSKGIYRAVADLYGDGALHDCPNYEWNGHNPPHGWRVSRENLERLHAETRIHYNSNGKPFRKEYRTEWEGQAVSMLWDDIPIARGRERTSYPTQKPINLLERIIRVSSNPNDMVFDPFCGCATACIAAEHLQRQWTGIDISSKAAELVRVRMNNELGLFYKGAHRKDVPFRTDLGQIIRYNDASNKRYLYGEQGGYCNG